MTSKILINALDPEECRIAKVKDGQLEEFHTESAAREITHGNIYKGIITRVEPGLQSVFVDYGAERHGFLQKNEIHSDYFQDNDSGDHSINNIVKRGQELIVQVTKDPVMKKGAVLTTFISLPGRYIVLMPGSKSRGISRKIEEESERTRLKDIINSLKLPDGFGIIVRTAGGSCTKARILRDLKYLLRLWKNINKKGIDESPPALLYKERTLVLRSIRDYFTSDIDEVLIDDEVVYHEVKDFIHIISPKHMRILKFYKGEKPIFTKYQLENQIASIFENRVALKTGGSVVIEQTEAMVTIDVNSGKAIHKKSIEQTAFRANIEAAEEIARQLRLRDLGGLIVIDFIDMKDTKHKLEVEKTIKNYLKTDKARTKVGKISKFGLMEMSRQRIRPSIEFGSYVPCKYCKGKGLIPSTETLGLGFLRRLHLETLKNQVSAIRGIVPVEVADYLLNKKRKEILDLELRHEISIRIEGDGTMRPMESNIVSEK
ncbi:Rne/Rng family ribonuclease [Desulfonema magnum]|uniref:Ribonuclease G n=1 Tax=Desulfonema magnum TaxID=45655 RepID=A0A975BPD3_9BACT|nr:Rne/Rng family ribonuclease [Desulfonema magnum]QTA89181.1 Ribonuclease, Rne/Rng family [Desulfonema magnum]